MAVLLEVVYRTQAFDFFAVELRAFNPAFSERTEHEWTLLALGDSFTAGLESYPRWLQIHLGRRWSVVNGGVPGITVRQASLVLERRLAEFEPRVLLYQTYVGNDLLDLRHPVSWRQVHPIRNSYWMLTDSGWTSLGFLNYRLGQIANRLIVSRLRDPELSSPERVAEIRNQEFSIDRYRERERMLLAADPHIIEKQIEVTGSMEPAWRLYSRYLDRIVERCSRDDVPVFILTIPHCVQVDQRYRDRFERLGAQFTNLPPPPVADSSFVTKLRQTFHDNPQVVVIDPVRVLQRAEAAGQRMYLNNDAHLSKAGQQVIGEFVAEVMKSGSIGESPNQKNR